ncbi:hypothetical protein [Saezia sanguinis]|uniref:hypothetical protein n=1 Tax=Saezia sanguinis TaxID=1965230 RepID=UPI00303D7010
MLSFIFAIIWFGLLFTLVWLINKTSKNGSYGFGAFCVTLFFILTGVLIKIYARLGGDLDTGGLRCLGRDYFNPCEAERFVVDGADLSFFGSIVIGIGVIILALLVIRYVMVFIFSFFK